MNKLDKQEKDRKLNNLNWAKFIAMEELYNLRITQEEYLAISDEIRKKVNDILLTR